MQTGGDFPGYQSGGNMSEILENLPERLKRLLTVEEAAKYISVI